MKSGQGRHAEKCLGRKHWSKDPVHQMSNGNIWHQNTFCRPSSEVVSFLSNSVTGLHKWFGCSFSRRGQFHYSATAYITIFPGQKHPNFMTPNCHPYYSASYSDIYEHCMRIANCNPGSICRAGPGITQVQMLHRRWQVCPCTERSCNKFGTTFDIRTVLYLFPFTPKSWEKSC